MKKSLLRIHSLTQLKCDGVALLSGAILPLAFAPFYLSFLAILSPALLLFILTQSPRRFFWRGFLFGCGVFAVGCSWVFISIYRFSGSGFFLSFLLTVLFIVVLALFFAIISSLFARFRQANALSNHLLLFPMLWVSVEWLRSWIFTGFPWLLLGYSQINSSLRGFIPVIGVYGLSFLCVFCAGLLNLLWHSALKRSLLILIIFMGIFVSGGLLNRIAWTRPNSSAISVALVQGNIPQSVKWQASRVFHILNTYFSLSLPYWHDRMIIWPEGAIPLVDTAATEYLNNLRELALKNHSTLLTGIATAIPNSPDYHNALIAVGTAHGIYFKRHLVPFGEFVPFENYLRPFAGIFNLPMSNFTAGKFHQPLIKLANLNIAAYLCYEIAYPNEVISTFNHADLIVNISDDSWFGKSFAAIQQFQMARFRALEIGRFVIATSNSGVTAIINAKGNVISALPLFQPAVLQSHVYAMKGTTPITHLTPNGVLLLLWFLFGGYCLRCFFKQKVKKSEKILYDCALAVEHDPSLQEEMKKWDITLQDGLEKDKSW
ncbi:MAG: apolipoprotein N-acyltransferase [Legionellales bacterium]|nr:apolipoprotein N-acyltransferase [Legionellales bacterium]